MYRIGILGCGRFAEAHFKAYPRLEPRAKWVAACHTERSRQRLEDVCDEHGIELRFTDVTELAACDEIDVVDVVTPPHVRLEVIRPLLEAGKHVLCAKPFADSLDEAREIVEAGGTLRMPAGRGPERPLVQRRRAHALPYRGRPYRCPDVRHNQPLLLARLHRMEAGDRPAGDGGHGRPPPGPLPLASAGRAGGGELRRRG